MSNATIAKRKSDRELVVSRTFNAPAHLVFEAWTRPELFQRWWTPKSTGMTMLFCDMDVRTGGTYRIEFGHPESDRPMVFFGRYVEVTPPSRLVWTNEESDEGAMTTVTFTEKNGQTLLVFHELYPSKEALDRAFEGMEEGMPEQFEQLDSMLIDLGKTKE